MNLEIYRFTPLDPVFPRTLSSYQAPLQSSTNHNRKQIAFKNKSDAHLPQKNLYAETEYGFSYIQLFSTKTVRLLVSFAIAILTRSRIPFNDDALEKAQRLKSRHALYNIQKNRLKLAVSPTRRAASPSVIITPMKRIPTLTNFREWIRLATDNKINATNSWTVALIDCFYEMSLLKEGDGVNYQRASSTLDGCVKIYTNRIDSTAAETGKLLSRLTDGQDVVDGRRILER